MTDFHATTILSVRRNGRVAMAGDGQVSLGATIAKQDAVKVRQIPDVGEDLKGVLVGFAGSAADAFALLDKFEGKLKQSPSNLMRASVELAKLWRTDRVLRRLESLLVVADNSRTLMISGQGDVIEPSDGTCAIGSGGPFALAAARALLENTSLEAADIARRAMEIAADICVYTNRSLTVLTLEPDQREAATAKGTDA